MARQAHEEVRELVGGGLWPLGLVVQPSAFCIRGRLQRWRRWPCSGPRTAPLPRAGQRQSRPVRRLFLQQTQSFGRENGRGTPRFSGDQHTQRIDNRLVRIADAKERRGRSDGDQPRLSRACKQAGELVEQRRLPSPGLAYDRRMAPWFEAALRTHSCIRASSSSRPTKSLR